MQDGRVTQYSLAEPTANRLGPDAGETRRTRSDSRHDGPPVPIAATDLDGYIEAQVHGGVSLETHVDAVVLDPSFRDTSVETTYTPLPTGRAFP